VIGESVGNFQIISRLGKGGMGEVWLAEQKSIKTKVAIKMLQASISTNKTHVQRFFNEAVAVSQIHHSGIVKIFDVGFHTGGQAYLVMEYLEGETLTSRIQRAGHLSVAQVADFGRQIASVLDATHNAGITHRDLKPDNIYLVTDAELAGGERVKVLDFGIAKLEVRADGGPRMTSLSVSSIGTPNYMSPEQWHSLAEVDWRTDAYAFGCVAFEMACGRPPFQGESMSDVCAMHLSEPPPVPSSLVPGLPPQLDELVARLLEKEPAQRPTMREAMAVFSLLGQPYAVAQTTLPPGSKSPLAFMPPQPAPAPPTAGAQAVAPVTTSAAASALADTALATSAPKRASRVGLFVLLAALALAGIAGAVVISRSPDTNAGANRVDTPAVADAGQPGGSALASVPPTPPSPPPLPATPGDARALAPADARAAEVAVDATALATVQDASAPADAGAVAGIDADAAITRDAPRAPVTTAIHVKTLGDRTAGQLPIVRSALELEVCIDIAGFVTSVSPKAPSSVHDAVMGWRFAPQRKAGAPTEACGPVKLVPARAPDRSSTAGSGSNVEPAALPRSLTPAVMDGILARNAAPIVGCGGGRIDASVSIAVTVDAAGTVTLVKALNAPPDPDFLRCLDTTLRRVKFPKSKVGGTTTKSFQLRYGAAPVDDGY
jgi:serine/threonine-protein kinase